MNRSSADNSSEFRSARARARSCLNRFVLFRSFFVFAVTRGVPFFPPEWGSYVASACPTFPILKMPRVYPSNAPQPCSPEPLSHDRRLLLLRLIWMVVLFVLVETGGCVLSGDPPVWGASVACGCTRCEEKNATGRMACGERLRLPFGAVRLLGSGRVAAAAVCDGWVMGPGVEGVLCCTFVSLPTAPLVCCVWTFGKAPVAGCPCFGGY